MRRSLVGVLLGVGCGLVVAAPALAVQLNLVGDERINVYQNTTGLPGTSYNTGPNGVDYDEVGGGGAHPGEFLVTGTVDALNFHRTGTPTTNEEYIFGQGLDFTLEAELLNIDIVPLFGTSVQIVMEFGSTADGIADLILTDPTDSTEVLRANLTSGDFDTGGGAQFTEAVVVQSAVIDLAAVPANPTLFTVAFFTIDPTSLYAPLFTDSQYLGIQLGQVLNWEVGTPNGSYDFAQIADALDQSSLLISHTAEANGTMFGLTNGQFTPVPEPGTAALLGLGLAGIATRARRRA